MRTAKEDGSRQRWVAAVFVAGNAVVAGAMNVLRILDFYDAHCFEWPSRDG